MGVYININSKGELVGEGKVEIADYGNVFEVAILVNEDRKKFCCLHHGATMVGADVLEQHIVNFHTMGDNPRQCSTCMTDEGTNSMHKAGKQHLLAIERRGWRLCLACFAVIKPGIKHSNHGEQFFINDLFEMYGLTNNVDKPAKHEKDQLSLNAVKGMFANREKTTNDRGNRAIAAISLGSKIAQEKGKVASYPMCSHHLYLTTGYKIQDVIPGCELRKVNLKCKCCAGIARMLQREQVDTDGDVYVIASNAPTLKLIECPRHVTVKAPEYPETFAFGDVNQLVAKYGPEVIAYYTIDSQGGCFRLKKKAEKAMRSGAVSASPFEYSPLAEAANTGLLKDEDIVDGALKDEDDVDPTEHIIDDDEQVTAAAQEKKEEAATPAADDKGSDQTDAASAKASTAEQAPEQPLDDVDGKSIHALRRAVNKQQNVLQENEQIAAEAVMAALEEQKREKARLLAEQKKRELQQRQEKITGQSAAPASKEKKVHLCPTHRTILNGGKCPRKDCDANPAVTTKKKSKRSADIADGPLKNLQLHDSGDEEEFDEE